MPINFQPKYCFLSINTMLMKFDTAYVKSESYVLNSNITTSHDSNEPPIMLAGEHSLTIRIEIPYGGDLNNWLYMTYKNLLKAWVNLTYTTHTITWEGKTYAKKGISLMGDSWRYDGKALDVDNQDFQDKLKKQSEINAKEARTPAEIKEDLKNKKQGLQDKLNNLTNEDDKNKLNIEQPSNRQYHTIPNWIQSTCFWIGNREHIPVGYLVSFSSSNDPNKSVETFEFKILEANFRKHTDEEVKTPKKEKEVKVKKIGRKHKNPIAMGSSDDALTKASQAKDAQDILDRANKAKNLTDAIKK